MTIVKDFFEEVSSFNSNIEYFNLNFVERKLTIYISSGLDIFPPHPLCDIHKSSEPSILLFDNVLSSKIEIYEYIEQGQNFKEKKIIENYFDCKNNYTAQYEEYTFEGVLKYPNAWITGNIFASEFYLDDLKK